MTEGKRIRRLSPSLLDIGLVWLAALICVGAAATVLLSAGLIVVLALLGLFAGQFWLLEVLVSAAVLSVTGVGLLRALQALAARCRRAGPP